MKDVSYDTFHQRKANRGIYQSVGMMNMYTAEGEGYIGSGTLIANRWVLTAAHNVAGMNSVSFTLGNKTYTAEKWYSHGGYDRTVVGNGHDIALVKLSSKVTGVRPTKIGNKRNMVDKEVTVVGYGSTGTGITGSVFAAGTKRAGDNRIDSYYSPKTLGKRIIMYDFDPDDPREFGFSVSSAKDDFALPLEYCGAPGDSGGGLFVGKELVGITSFGTIGSMFFSTAGATDVTSHANWIRQVKRKVWRGQNLGWLADIGSTGNPLPELVGDGAEIGAEVYTNLLAYVGTPTPEPTSVALLVTGGIGMLLRRGRRAA